MLFLFVQVLNGILSSHPATALRPHLGAVSGGSGGERVVESGLWIWFVSLLDPGAMSVSRSVALAALSLS